MELTMKNVLAICILLAAMLGGCAIVPADYGYRDGYRHYHGDGRYDRGDRYYRGGDDHRYGDHDRGE
jgi:hypothetical protein